MTLGTEGIRSILDAPLGRNPWMVVIEALSVGSTEETGYTRRVEVLFAVSCKSAPLSFLVAQHVRPHTEGLVSGVTLMCRVTCWINVLSCEGVQALSHGCHRSTGDAGQFRCCPFQGRDLQDAPAALKWLSLLCQGPWSKEKGLDLCAGAVAGTDLPKSSGGGSVAVTARLTGGHQ